MRRHHDDYINATQLLNIKGIPDRGQRTELAKMTKLTQNKETVVKIRAGDEARTARYYGERPDDLAWCARD